MATWLTQLRCCVRDGATHALYWWTGSTCHAKVWQLDFTALPVKDEHILRLDVTMHQFLRVKVVQCQGHLMYTAFRQTLWQPHLYRVMGNRGLIKTLTQTIWQVISWNLILPLQYDCTEHSILVKSNPKWRTNIYFKRPAVNSSRWLGKWKTKKTKSTKKKKNEEQEVSSVIIIK